MSRKNDEQYLNKVYLKNDLCAFFYAWQALQHINCMSMPGNSSNYLTRDPNGLIPIARAAIKELIDDFDERIRTNPVVKGTFLKLGAATLRDALWQTGMSWRVPWSNAPFLASLIYDALFSPGWKPENWDYVNAVEEERENKRIGKVYEATVTRVQKATFQQIAQSEQDARNRIETLHKLGWFFFLGDRSNPEEWSFCIGDLHEVESDKE